MKANVYVDGLNLYYGALKNTDFEWLNLESLIQNLCKEFEINRIKYYSAKIKARREDGNEDKLARQQIYWRALRTISKLEIIEGYFLEHKVRAKVVGTNEYVKIYKTEEKGTDVNIATQMVNDAHNKKFDVAILITNDSDLVEPIKIVTKELNLQVILISPYPRNSVQLLEHASSVRHLRKGVLEVSQFSDVLIDEVGEFTKPKNLQDV